MTMARSLSIVAIVVVVCQVFHCHAQPATYTVGDDLGWSPLVRMDTWPEGKTLYAGDILVFQYDAVYYNVAIVNRTGFETCSLTEGAQVYSSGDDKIQVQFGETYFIETFDDLCPAGMKMAINATARPPLHA